MQQSIIDLGDDLLTDLQQRFAPDDIEALIEALFEATDRNADGRVTFDEFKATVETHPYIYRQMHGPVFWQWVTCPSSATVSNGCCATAGLLRQKNPDRSGDRAASPDPHGPDWDDIFTTVAEAHTSDKPDVFFCDPPGLGKTLKTLCIRHDLRFRKENF